MDSQAIASQLEEYTCEAGYSGSCSCFCFGLLSIRIIGAYKPAMSQQFSTSTQASNVTTSSPRPTQKPRKEVNKEDCDNQRRGPSGSEMRRGSSFPGRDITLLPSGEIRLQVFFTGGAP
jgi:hypothetical protein